MKGVDDEGDCLDIEGWKCSNDGYRKCDVMRGGGAVFVGSTAFFGGSK